jgi:hypothetical protein
MPASEDSAQPADTGAAGAAGQRDDLEHWLSDLRTDAAADPSGWAEAQPEPSGWAEAGPEPDAEEPSVPRPTSVGRHRSPD